MKRKDYTHPQSECIEVSFKSAICQMSGVGTEGTEDVELDLAGL